MSSKDVMQLARAVELQGWVVERTKGDHLRWIPPDKDQPFYVSALTPSDVRSIRNIRAELRRRGAKL